MASEALKRRGLLTLKFDPWISWDAAWIGRRGRQQTYGDAAIQTCLTIKVLFGMALLQATASVESLLSLIALTWGARRQHFVPTAEDPCSECPILRLQGAAAPVDR